MKRYRIVETINGYKHDFQAQETRKIFFFFNVWHTFAFCVTMEAAIEHIDKAMLPEKVTVHKIN